MRKKILKPDFLFNVSWEVCNKVGGIYTVLSTQAKTLQTTLKDNLFFIGPDLTKDDSNPLFVEDPTLFKSWTKSLADQPDSFIRIRIGRWMIPGNPIVILVDFEPYYAIKDKIYGFIWEHYQVDSLHGYGDYDEASMFSIAAAKVVESFYVFHKLEHKNVAYHAHEWMCGMGALYIQQMLPQVATLFTTHATTVGRSIAGNYKPLYDNLTNYCGDQMARELNVESKHSIEKQTAHAVDCFTTVSDITAKEAEQLREKPIDVVLKNGFENDFVPKGAKFTSTRNAARKQLIAVAQKVLGKTLADDTLIVGTSGRYELKNKGLDAFVDAMNSLNQLGDALAKDILAYIFVPAWVGEARQDLAYRMQNLDKPEITPLEFPYITHWLHQMDHDPILSMMRERGLINQPDSRVKLIFVPCYLNESDGIFNMSYYDVLIGQDITIYPSYYEPWGYTPLESIAFKVPTVTTNLSGFGAWVETVDNYNRGLSDGVAVLERTDHNYSEIVENISKTISDYAALDTKEINRTRNRASQLSDRALWSKFIEAYYEAYALAFTNRDSRIDTN